MLLFGTDGIRAPFGQYPLDRPTVTTLGFRLGETLAHETGDPTVIIGGDTRQSTPEISQWLAAGLTAAGTRARFAGVVPTPAIAMLVGRLGADAGIAVSASHNPHPDNGIKLFDRQGFKWDPVAEAELESLLTDPWICTAWLEKTLAIDPSLAQTYIDSLLDFGGRHDSLAGLKIVVDAANGAASPFAAPIFQQLGAEVVMIGDQPDGRNINAGCGSTVPEPMARVVAERGADLGVAFDGDADRVILADDKGQVRDGDAMIFLWARELVSRGDLEPPRIVATSMSNLGLERALEPLGISVVRCDVGDRTVVATMRQERVRLGGEQSGHIVNTDLTTTGDGLLTAIQIALITQRGVGALSTQLTDFRRYPQILRNLRVERKPDLQSLPGVVAARAEVESQLGSQGRLVLRYSGTEPLARVMIEGPDGEEIERLAALLIETLDQEIGKL